MSSRTPRRRLLGAFAIAGVIAAQSGRAHATPLVAGNLVATVTDSTGLVPTPTYIAEYQTAGARVQVLANVPQPGGTAPTQQPAGDLVTGPGNAIHLFNGYGTPYLARLDLGTLTWSQQTYPGWTSFARAGLGAVGQFVFATDATGNQGDPQGIVRFDTSGGPTTRFAETIAPVDVAIAPDTTLYALANQLGSWSAYRYDPATLAPLGSILLEGAGAHDDLRALAVAPDGSIVVGTWEGEILRYSGAGLLLDSLSLPGMNFQDVDIDPLGRIALGTGGTGFDGGKIVLTDLALDAASDFRATNNANGGSAFVAWIPVPEPSTAALMTLGISLCALRRPRSGA